MSILMRKAAQELLDSNGLSSFHVRINNKHLTIVGECGQPLVTVRGIKFTRDDPSQKEIAYAVELLDAFILKHKHSIENLMDKKKKAAAYKVDALVHLKEKDGRYKYTHHVVLSSNPKVGLGMLNGEVRVAIDAGFTVTEFNSLNVDDVVMKEYKKYVKQKEMLKQLEKDFLEAKASLETCDI